MVGESKYDDNDNDNNGGGATPHRSKRINLGTPANYYFKYMNSSKKSENNEFMVSKDEGDTGTISIHGLNLGGGQATESSFLSLAGSSISGSEGNSELLNRSTLSDTTELTASNFVLVTTSKQNMIQKSRNNYDADMENSTNTKVHDLKTQSNVPPVNVNAVLSCLESSFRHKDGHEDKTTKAEKITQRSEIRKEKVEIQKDGSHFTSMKNASPSLRSRIGSSPASLRKFHENLKNSRIQRQLQREEDTKRRFSIEDKNSLHSMDEQLEALTSDTILKRERLPPTFTQLTQQSLSQRYSIASDSRQSSPAQSNTDSTNSVSMEELNNILGIKNSTSLKTQSPVTARYSSIQRLLDEDNTQGSISGKEQTAKLSFLGNSSFSAIPSAISNSKNIGNDSEPKRDTRSPKSNSVLKDLQPDQSSPKIAPSMKHGSTTAESRKEMTTTKASLATKRVVNPQSISSPASNTRSAKKRRKLNEEKIYYNLPCTENVVDETKQSPQSDRSVSPGVHGTRNISDISIALESGSTGKLDQLSSKDHDSGSSSVKNNDTASLGDIADIFGIITTDKMSPHDETSISLPVNDHFEKLVEGARQLRNDQETASIGDINEILNSFPINQDSPSHESNVSEAFSQHTKTDDDYATKRLVEEKKLEFTSPVKYKLSERSLSSGKSEKISESSTEANALAREMTNDVVSEFTDGHLKNARNSPGNNSDLPSVNEGNDTVQSESNNIIVEHVESKSAINDLPTTPPSLILSHMSSDHKRSSSQSINLTPEEFDHGVENRSCETNLTKSFPKSPIRLTPNSHIKPTPTKLAPTPRRVLNPKNANSPARNTRSSSKRKSLFQNSDSLLSAEDISSQACVTNHGVLRPSKYIQSSTTESDLSCVRNMKYKLKKEEALSHVRTRDQRPSFGILSSKKKGFPQRSVAFGSPEAAEYNIGSPSVSLTPMPKGRAKALFCVPERLNRDEGNYQRNLNHEGNDVDDYVESESDMKYLVDKMTVEQMNNSPELSPIAKRKTDTDAFKVPSERLNSTMSHFLAAESDSMSSQGYSSHMENTVELEAGMEGVLLNNLKLSKENILSKLKASPSISQADSRDNSVELADSESIVSIHSKGEKYTGNFVFKMDAQKRLDFSFATEASKSNSYCTEGEEGKTVEIEGNMLSLLKAAENKVIVEKQGTSIGINMAVDSASSITANLQSAVEVREGKTVELEGDMLSLLEAAEKKATVKEREIGDQMDMTLGSVSLTVSDTMMGNSKNNTQSAEVEEGTTVELEDNMMSLLTSATKNKTTEEEKGTTDQVGVTEDSISSIIANSKRIFHDTDVEDGKTVELEGNMLSLLEAAAKNKSTEVGKENIKQMDVTECSVSLAVNEIEMIREVDSHRFDSIVGILKSTTHDTHVEEGKTVELEGNMLSLLEVAIGKKSEEEEKRGIIDQMDMTADSVSLVVNDVAINGMDPQKSAQLDHLEEFDHKTTRLTSLSSSSFTLNQVDEGQISINNIIAEHKYLVMDKSVSFCDTKEFITNLSAECGSPDDHTKELPIINVATLTNTLLKGLKYEEMQGDGISECFSQFGKSNDDIDMIVAERWGQFIEAVCGEVEGRTDSEGEAAASLSELIEADPKFYCMVQNRLKSNEVGSTIEKSLDLIVEKGKILVDYEFNCWLANVLESFHGPLNDISNNFAHDTSRLAEALQHCNMLQSNISLVNDRKTARARRKSFLRHQTVVTDLTGEIEIIESRLSKIKSELDKLEGEEENILKLKTDYHEMFLNEKEHNNLRAAAESAQKSLLSLRGLHSWSMGTMSGIDMEFVTLGSCSQTHLKLLYEGAKSDKLQTRLSSKVDSNHEKTKSLYVYHGPISVFLDSSIKRLIHTAQRSSLGRSIRISEHLQNYSWLIGQLDLIAKEFQIVQRRYNGKLRRTERDEKTFLFLVEFENAPSKIVVEFEIEPMMYPSFPVEVHLDLISGEVDMSKLRRNLRKNAKAGFGSITKACDIVQSIIRG